MRNAIEPWKPFQWKWSQSNLIIGFWWWKTLFQGLDSGGQLLIKNTKPCVYVVLVPYLVLTWAHVHIFTSEYILNIKFRNVSTNIQIPNDISRFLWSEKLLYHFNCLFSTYFYDIWLVSIHRCAYSGSLGKKKNSLFFSLSLLGSTLIQASLSFIEIKMWKMKDFL